MSGELSGRVALVAGVRAARIDAHLITSHHLLPLLIRSPGGLVVELTDGTAEYNAEYRQVVRRCRTTWRRRPRTRWRSGRRQNL
ncbi:hypothetical protein GCM10022222_48550 [Amycolatopsis ultiminotia]|uniref:Uncharacterized protein n=1 Tax=Amycolatopsis ultiminotia TaxID=543629 RepID=A0ABP6WZR7_9PSEU